MTGRRPRRAADLAVVGGGIVGLSTAYFAAEAGLSVAVFDKEDLGRGASWAGAGVLMPLHPETYPPELLSFCLEGARFWDDFAVRLTGETGIDVGYLSCGAVELFRGEDAPGRAQEKAAWWRARGIRAEALDGEGLARRAPRAAPAEGALWLPDAKQVRNPRAIRALVAALRSRGVALRPHAEVTAVEDGEVALRARGGRERFRAEAVVVAAGAWTKRLLPNVKVRPVRGQIVLLRADLDLAPIVIDGEYVVPRGDGLFLAGSTVEEAGFDDATTAAGVAHLTKRAAELVPGLADAERVRAWAGLRPGSDDGLPWIGHVQGKVYVASGHFRHGLILGPITGRLLARSVLTGRDEAALAPFSPRR